MKRVIILVFLNLLIGVNLSFAQSNCIEEIGTIENTIAFGIGLKENYLYVNPGFSYIKYYNISNPANPTLEGQINYTGNFEMNLDVSGDYLYIYGGPDNRLIIFDIVNPTSPIELGTLQLPPSANGIWHAAHLADYTYMTSRDTIFVINTTDKNSPFIENRIAHSVAGSYGLKGIFATSEILYIGIENGILIYDNSNLSLPVYYSLYENGCLNLAVDTNNHRLYSAYGTGTYTHYISDIIDPYSPNLIFQGYGGSNPWGELLVNDDILVQTGLNSGENQAVSFYKIQSDTTAYIEDFLGSVMFSVTDMDAVDSLYFIAKNGGIEILKYNGCTITGIDNSLQFNNIELYPNPTKDIITINVNNEPEDMVLEIIDCYGKTLIKKNIIVKTENIDLQNLNNGLYIVVLTQNGKKIFSRKVLKK